MTTAPNVMNVKSMFQLRPSAKVALVHDWLVGNGGGERVLYDFHQLFPDAPIYTLVYDEQKAPNWTKTCDIRTTYIQKWPGAKSHHKLLLSFMPKAWESVDLNEYDLVLSSCSSCCKGVITRPESIHICYCHSPIRYVWDLYFDYLKSSGFFKQKMMRLIIHKVRMWDYLAAQRPDYFIANSNFVNNRICKYYRRDAATIYPATAGANSDRSCLSRGGEYYLVISRFVGYKRIDLAIDACNKLQRKLIVVGSGGEAEDTLRNSAGSTIEFRRNISDEELKDLYIHARAFLFPGIEDFGLTPIEAMSYGVPVIAYGRGGALETVQDGITGLHFNNQSVDGLVDCMLEFENKEAQFNREQIFEWAQEFSSSRFRQEIMSFIGEVLEREKKI